MSSSQRTALNMLSSAAGYGLPMLVNVVTTPLLLRALGQTAYGLSSLVGVIVGYLSFMDMGLDVPIIKLLAEDRARQDVEAESRLLSTTLQAYALVGMAGMVAIVLLAAFFANHVFSVPPDMVRSATVVFRLAGLGFLGSVAISWGRAVAMGAERFDLSYSVSVLTSIAGTLVGLLAAYKGFGVVGYVFVRVLLSVSAGPAYLMVTRSLLPEWRFRWGLDSHTLRRLGGYLGYGALNRITGSLFSRLDQTLIGVWVGVAAAGVYAVPFMIVNSFGYMVSYVGGFIFPLASGLSALGEMDRLRDILTRATRFITAVAGIIFMPVFVFGDLLLVLWVPSIAAEATKVIGLLTLASYLGTIGVSLINNVVIGMGRVREYTLYANARGIVLGAACVVLIRPLGLRGAGLALLITVSVDLVYLLVVLRQYLNMSYSTFFRRSYLKPCSLTCILGSLAFFARPLAHSWLGLAAVVGVLEAVFIAAGYLIGVFGETEKQVISGLWHRLPFSGAPSEHVT